MMVYNLISHRLLIDGVSVTAYGIAIYKREILFRVIENMSTDLSATQSFIDILNEEKPELIHIDDIVEDFCLEYT